MGKLCFWFYAGIGKAISELTFRRITRKQIHSIFISFMTSIEDSYSKNKLLVSYKDIRIYAKKFYFTSNLRHIDYSRSNNTCFSISISNVSVYTSDIRYFKWLRITKYKLRVF